MAQYNPQAQQGGRGTGRGGGRGYGGPNPPGGPQGQQQGRPMGAWQPTAPTSSLQQASYGRQPQPGGYHPAQHQQQGPPPPSPYGAQMGHYNPYMAQQGGYRGPQGGPGGWQPPTGYPGQAGMYYPQAGGHPGAAGGPGGAPTPPVVQPPKPREKKPLVITDKNGNVLDFRSEQAKQKSSLQAAVAGDQKSEPNKDAAAAATPAPAPSQDAGAKLREAALARLNEKGDTAVAKEKAAEPSKEDEKPITPAPTPVAPDAKPAAPASVPKATASAVAPPAPAVAPPVPVPAPAPAPTKPAPTNEEKKERVPPSVSAPAPAKEEKKEPEPKPATPAAPPATAQPKKSLADIAAAPPPARGAPTKGTSSLQAAAQPLKKSLADIAAAPPPAPKSPAGGLRPGGKMRSSPGDPTGDSGKERIVYDKKSLLKFKSLDICGKRPDDLPDLVIVKGPAKQQGNNRRGSDRGGGGGGAGGGGSNWDRGQAPPRNQRNNNNNNNDWQRGQAPPKNKNSKGNRRNSNQGNQPFYDGPVAPLVKSENRWKPQKNVGPLQAAEKKVKGILNKMTKEKFEPLSQQICDIHILSYDMLTMMIHNIYEKAIDEPAFGDMYADLCVRLSKGAAQANNNFVHIIESDEEPPMEDGDEGPESQPAGSSSHVVYRWSNDVGTTDEEIVGPYPTIEECMDVALNSSGEPVNRGDIDLELAKLKIQQGMFMKIMKKKGSEDEYYVVYFPVDEAEDAGQQLSEIFLSEVECSSDAKKKNSFKRSLLNKCEDEFKKQDIYVDWKAEKKAYDETKHQLKPTEQVEREGELDFRRIKIKKQMLGNVKFIGQLYKKGLLKEKIMRFCIGSLLKLEEIEDDKSKNPEYKDNGDIDMDEEDHEAICNMFTTIGSTIDKPHAADFMNVCFAKIEKLSNDKKNLPARSRFMYKDLLELRANNWVPRRDEGKAKTLEEIRKDVEKEERRQAQQSQENYRSDRRSSQPSGGRGSGGYDNRRGSQSNFGGRGGGGAGSTNKRTTGKQPETTIDEDGFTVIGRGNVKGHFQVEDSGGRGSGSQRNLESKGQQSMPSSGSKSSFAALVEDKKSSSAGTPEPLSPEKLERRIKNMRAEYMMNNNAEELLVAMDELRGTKDAGLTLVNKSVDAMLDCKAAERKAIVDVTRILFENGKLSKEEIQAGLADFIEYIDTMIIDCPKLFEFIGEWLGVLFVKKAVDIQWFCDAVEKTKSDPNTQAPEKLTRATISSIRNTGGMDAAKECFGSETEALNKLLGADKWSAISNDLLG